MPLLANINVGSAPNDGTGDSIRESFIIVNENFQYIEQFFPNTALVNLNANITSTGTSTFNIVNISGVLTSTSNISTSGLYLGNGSQLTGVGASTAQFVTGNAQANITSVGTLTSLTVGGNITSGNLNTTGSISGTIITPSQTAITSVGTLSSLQVSGNINGANLSLTGTTGQSRILANGVVIDKLGSIIYETSLLTNVNITNANINFANTFALTYGLRTANANVTFNYGNITTGSNFILHLKNTTGSVIYALMPNDTNNKGSNTVPITANSVATFTFVCYDTTAANVVATIIN